MNHRLVPLTARVLALSPLKAGHFELVLAAPAVAQEAEPGQFLQVRVAPGLDPLLRRPLSLSSWDADSGEVRLWVRQVGKGTTLLGQLRPGDTVDILGPLGRGFPSLVPGGLWVVVAGGIGVAPLMQLLARAREAEQAVIVCLGARSRHQLLGVEELAHLGVNVLTATDDGSEGQPGLVTDVLQQVMSPAVSAVMACGPIPMLQSVRQVLAGWPGKAYVSLEAHMACGVGACQGCVVKAREGPGYYRVCVDGPVFALEQLDWDAMKEEGV